ncbi:MAG: L,D-transpeptidase family protein [Phycisphaeraceae bacterium]|nr:L,D-transpeptidase family protein [Phycisphaeraceae bacterium]
MALPSQVERTAQMSRPIMTRSTRSKVSPAVIGGAASVCLLVVVGIAYFLFWRGTPSQAEASTDGGAPQIAKGPVGSEQAARLSNPGASDTRTPVRTTPPHSTQIAKSLNEAMGGEPDLNDVPMGMSPYVKEVEGAGPLDPTKPLPVDASRPDLVARPADRTSGDVGTPAGAPGSVVQQPPALTPTGSPQAVRTHVEQGERAMAAGRPVEARVAYSKALLHPEASKADQQMLRQRLTAINDELVFSPKVTAGDPLAETYTVVAGDSLDRIRRKRELASEWMLIQRVNRIASPNSLQIGQKLKLLRGPFHAIVTKSDFRLDLFAGSPDEPEGWVYIRSFPVGLGEGNGTPVGTFVIRNKQQNPAWTNPRTGERFAADDPKNPIGEYWLGWQGVGDSAVFTGFGIHGTIDPGSIGQQKSMGCVRLGDADVAMVYEFLIPRVSMVRVVP